LKINCIAMVLEYPVEVGLVMLLKSSPYPVKISRSSP